MKPGQTIIKNLIKITRQPFISLLYHSVCDLELPHIKHLYSVPSQKQFEKDLDFLLSIYQPVSVQDVMSQIHSGNGFIKPSFLITFDDGLREVYDIAAPILLRKGIPAVLFVNTSFVDNKNLFFRFKAGLIIEKIRNSKNALKDSKDAGFDSSKALIDFLKSARYFQQNIIDEIAGSFGINYSEYLKNHKPYMTTEELVDLQQKGFCIGSHSMDHPLLNQLNFQDQTDQILNSFKELETLVKVKEKFFAFPFTDFGVQKALFEKIYQYGVDLTFGTAGLKKDVFIQNIQRIPVENFSSVQRALLFEYCYFLAKLPLGKNRVQRA